jgi:two-component system, NarL family, invasion response regulator UvrY
MFRVCSGLSEGRPGVKKVLVADHQPVFRRGLRQVIEEIQDLQVAGEAGDGQAAMLRATTGDYDLVVLDIDMPLQDGFTVLREIKRERPSLPVIVFSMRPEEEYALRSLRAGASGYLSRDSDPDEFKAAFQKILEGGTYVSPALAQHLLASLVQKESEVLPHSTLSARENQIMCLIASGRTVSQIARDLSLSVKTVSTHRTRILSKMNLRNNADIARYATQNRLVD